MYNEALCLSFLFNKETEKLSNILKFPLANFVTVGITSSELVAIFWKAVVCYKSVKWRALRALVPSMLACPRAQIFGVPSCHRCWRALMPSCPNFRRALVPSMLACPRARVPKFSACPKFLACPRAFDVDVQDTLEGCDP